MIRLKFSESDYIKQMHFGLNSHRNRFPINKSTNKSRFKMNKLLVVALVALAIGASQARPADVVNHEIQEQVSQKAAQQMVSFGFWDSIFGNNKEKRIALKRIVSHLDEFAARLDHPDTGLDNFFNEVCLESSRASAVFRKEHNYGNISSWEQGIVDGIRYVAELVRYPAWDKPAELASQVAAAKSHLKSLIEQLEDRIEELS